MMRQFVVLGIFVCLCTTASARVWYVDKALLSAVTSFAARVTWDGGEINIGCGILTS